MSESSKAVFLSYASQDAAAVERIAEALRAAGVEVWFDKNELVGGDAWDQKIRKQIKDCALFVPVISAATQARGEGYFRLEWKLAVDRSHLMAPDQPFLLPVVIDDTPDAAARVVDEFRAVQWTRLIGGETPEKFCARVKKLLGGSVVAGVADPGSSGKGTPASARPATTKPRSRWLVPTIIGAAVLVALAVWQPWKKLAPVSSSAVATPAAPLTEAQKLVAQARKIFDEGDELNRETYALADELLKRAEGLDLTDGAMWALHARVSAQSYIYGLDASPARREAMLTQAARAAKLAPDSLDAALASAAVRVALRQELPVLQESLKKLAAANGNDPQILRLLVRAYGLDGKSDEASEVSRQALRLSPDDPRSKADLVNYLRVNNRLAEAEVELEPALHGRMNARLWAFDAWLKLVWRGDAAAAATVVQKWPRWFLEEDRGAGLAAVIFMWNNEPAKAIETLRNFPRDDINDTIATAPRAAFTALARELSGQAGSARADWQVALQVAERKLGTAPDDAVALHWKAWALARLGDHQAATAGFNQLREKIPSLPSGLYLFGGLSSLALTIGQVTEGLTDLQPVLYNGQVVPRPPTRGILRLNPAFAPVRNDPRFQALVESAPAPEAKAETKTTTIAAPVVSEKSLVVLPLENLSPDPENAFFTDGLHTEIISALQGIADLKVIGRDTSLTLKRGSAPVAELAQRVGVANVITGSVRRAGNTVRIQLELRRASDDALLWSLPKGDRDLKDVLGLQSEVADEVARVLQARTEKGSTAGARFLAAEPRVYDLYLKAYGIYRANTGDRARIAECVAMMDEALRLDPKFMPAARLAGRMAARMFLLTNDPDEQVRCAGEAKKWSELAARLMPGGAGDGALAYYYDFVAEDYPRALTYAENSIRALPNDVEGYHVAALALLNMGRLEEAAKKWEQVEALDTGSVPSWGFHIRVLSQLRRKAACEELIAQFQRVSDSARIRNVNEGATLLARFTLEGALPTAADQIFSATERAEWLWRERRFAELLALCEAQLGPEPTARFRWLRRKSDALLRLNRKDEAVAAAREALTIAQALQARPKIGLPVNDGRLAGALARLGQADEAIAKGRSNVEAVPAVSLSTRWFREIELAGLYAFLNRPRECVELLAKLLRVPSGITVPMLKVDPTWDSVREDPGFKALLADPKNSAPL